MPLTYETISREVVISTAEAMNQVVARLTQVAAEMEQSGLRSAYFPWTKHQETCVDIVIALSSQCVALMPEQILAKLQGRKCRYELIKEKSARDVAARNLRLGNPPKKQRGRPRLRVPQGEVV